MNLYPARAQLAHPHHHQAADYLVRVQKYVKNLAGVVAQDQYEISWLLKLLYLQFVGCRFVYEETVLCYFLDAVYLPHQPL